jgi:hypothetical protein
MEDRALHILQPPALALPSWLHSVGNFHATCQTSQEPPRAACILLDGMSFFAIFSSWSSNGKIYACCLGPDAHETTVTKETPYSKEVRADIHTLTIGEYVPWNR